MKIKYLLVGLLAATFGLTSCEKEDPIPTSATVNSITVKSFPGTDANGDLWDLTTAADIYVTMGLGTSASSSLYESPTYFNDAPSSGTYTFSGGLPVQLTATQTYNIAVWDLDDLDADDLIGGLTFVPNDFYVSGTTSTITLSNAGFEIQVNVTWGF